MENSPEVTSLPNTFPLCLLEGVMVAHVFLLAMTLVPAKAAFTLTVAHTNDVHARFEQFSKYGSDCREKDAKAGKCYGGVARRVTALKQLRHNYTNLLLLDGGDQFQGTLWFFVHRGHAASYFMNLLQYDAMALGNHEFDNGIEGLVPFLQNVTFPMLSCNINTTLHAQIAASLHPSVVMRVGGERVGIIGYTTTDTPELSNSGNIIFSDEVSAIKQEVTKLEALGVNKIIALGHAGWKIDLAIAREVDGVDLVVGGHTNTFLFTGPAPAHETPIGQYPEVVKQTSGDTVLAVQDYAFGKYLGVLHVTFDDDGKVTHWEGNPLLMDASIEQDPATLQMMTSWKAPLIASFSQVLGRSHVYLDGTRASCRLQECNLGNFLTDAMVMWHLKAPDEEYWANVSIAIHNGGGIRSSISAGEVTLKDAYNVHPFANTIDLVELQGHHLEAVFEHSVWDFDPVSQKGRFLQVAGIRVVYDLMQPNGHRVVSLHLRCSDCTVPRYQQLRQEVVYKVILPSFLAAGGDGYDIIPRHMKHHHVYGDLDIDLLMRHIGAQSPIIAGMEGRISFVDAGYCTRPGCDQSVPTQEADAATGICGILMSLPMFLLLALTYLL